MLPEDSPHNLEAEFWRRIRAVMPVLTPEQEAEVRRFMGTDMRSAVADGLAGVIAELEAKGYEE
jgi:hypothetical protein